MRDRVVCLFTLRVICCVWWLAVAMFVNETVSDWNPHVLYLSVFDCKWTTVFNCETVFTLKFLSEPPGSKGIYWLEGFWFGSAFPYPTC